MDFIDPKQRRMHIIRLFIGYFFVAILIIFAAVILLYQSYGFDLDRKTGKVIQNGLIFVSSKPVSANIYLNGVAMKSGTDTRLTVPEAEYSVQLLSDGYRPWFRKIDLAGGSIEHITYPLLIPNKLTTTTDQTIPAISSFITQSLDKRWLVTQKSSALNELILTDLNNSKAPGTALNLPGDIFTTAPGTHSLRTETWASDNKHFLVRHDYGTNYEYVMVDRESPSLSYNVSKTVLLPGATMTLLDRKFDAISVYDIVSHGLYTYDTKAKQLSLVLQNVFNYKTYGTQLVLYSTDNGVAGSKINVKIWNGSVSNILQVFDPGTVVKLDIAQFSGDYYYVVATSKQSGRAYIYKNPEDTIQQSSFKSIVPLNVLPLDDIQFLTFSEGTRFIAVQNGSKFVVYDIWVDKRFSFTTKVDMTNGQKAVWMDGFRLYINTAGLTNIFDFDGSNPQVLAPAIDNTGVYFNRDFSSYYSLALSTANPGQTLVTKTNLRLP